MRSQRASQSKQNQNPSLKIRCRFVIALGQLAAGNTL
jgi:hypothetical protein